MRIASNSRRDITRFFIRELKDIYTEEEIQRLLQWSLEKILNTSSSYLAAHADLRVSESDLVKLEQICYELKTHKPIQYILGETEFFGLTFRVNKHVLIPRPETEELVEHAVKALQQQSKKNYRILDLGTGSGCIAIALKKQLPSANVFAADVSPGALELANTNAKLNNLDVTFLEADMLDKYVAAAIRKVAGTEPFDLIISNPPYILHEEEPGLHKRVKNFEPSLALFVEGNDPLLFYRRIADIAADLLASDGTTWLECHASYASSVGQMLRDTRLFSARLHKDLSGNERFVSAQRLV
jgi:release factor glutamine methyltransferase